MDKRYQVASKFSVKLHWMNGTKILFLEDIIKSIRLLEISITWDLFTW